MLSSVFGTIITVSGKGLIDDHSRQEIDPWTDPPYPVCISHSNKNSFDLCTSSCKYSLTIIAHEQLCDFDQDGNYKSMGLTFFVSGTGYCEGGPGDLEWDGTIEATGDATSMEPVPGPGVLDSVNICEW